MGMIIIPSRRKPIRAPSDHSDECELRVRGSVCPFDRGEHFPVS